MFTHVLSCYCNVNIYVIFVVMRSVHVYVIFVVVRSVHVYVIFVVVRSVHVLRHFCASEICSRFFIFCSPILVSQLEIQSAIQREEFGINIGLHSGVYSKSEPRYIFLYFGSLQWVSTTIDHL